MEVVGIARSIKSTVERLFIGWSSFYRMGREI